jgi:hypothetical protein
MNKIHNIGLGDEQYTFKFYAHISNYRTTASI